MTQEIFFSFPSEKKTWYNCQQKRLLLSKFFEYLTYDHRLKGVFMLESHAFFSKMVDELVEFSEYDPELADGIKWLDDQAQKKVSRFMIWSLKSCTNMM